MPRRLLFIEDEEDFARAVSSYLEKEGFSVVHAASGKDGLLELRKKAYDLVILDLGLPDEDGLALCGKIRNRETLPILILTARDEVQDKVNGLNLGADDYLAKPVPLKELVVRIRRLLKRNFKRRFRSSVFQFQRIKFDTVSGELTSGRRSVKLTKKEKAVLEYLLLKKNRVLTRMEIMDHVWGDELDILSNTVNVVISSLRRKLRQLSGNDFIRSVHGLGYQFETNTGGAKTNE